MNEIEMDKAPECYGLGSDSCPYPTQTVCALVLCPTSTRVCLHARRVGPGPGSGTTGLDGGGFALVRFTSCSPGCQPARKLSSVRVSVCVCGWVVRARCESHQACDADANCTWCKCAAVPSKCYNLTEAKILPPSVFACDKTAAVHEATQDAVAEEAI